MPGLFWRVVQRAECAEGDERERTRIMCAVGSGGVGWEDGGWRYYSYFTTRKCSPTLTLCIPSPRRARHHQPPLLSPHALALSPASLLRRRTGSQSSLRHHIRQKLLRKLTIIASAIPIVRDVNLKLPQRLIVGEIRAVEINRRRDAYELTILAAIVCHALRVAYNEDIRDLLQPDVCMVGRVR